MANLALLVPVLFLAVFVQNGESVRCWACSSDLNPYCADPYLPHRGNQDNVLYRLENCDSNSAATYPFLTTSKSSCKKQKKYVNNQLIVSRGCTWKRADDFSTQCPSSTAGPNELISYCETCDYDGCNGAASISQAVALLLTPLAFLLFK